MADVPSFDPFPGLRYDPERFDPAEVTAPPYDVLDEADREALAARHPANVVAVDLPRADGDPYAAAAEIFATWLADGTLVADAPAFYVYRMAWTAPDGTASATTGVLGSLTLSGPDEGEILPHEHTTPKASTDRHDLLTATRVNLSPIWVLSPADGLTTLLPTEGDPDLDFTAPDGVRHQLWLVSEPERVAAISAAVGSEPVLIADGHHRYHTSLAYRDERRTEVGDDAGAEAVLAWVVELAERELTVDPIHRLVHVSGGADPLAALARTYELEPVDREAVRSWVAAGEGPGVVSADGAWRARPRPEAVAGLAELDTAHVAAAVAGVEGLELSYQHEIDLALARLDAGEADAVVLVRPPSVAAMLAIAHGGERTPPKTTFFTPKPRTGLVFRALDDPSPQD